jgi:hypothetical protein
MASKHHILPLLIDTIRCGRVIATNFHGLLGTIKLGAGNHFHGFRNLANVFDGFQAHLNYAQSVDTKSTVLEGRIAAITDGSRINRIANHLFFHFPTRPPLPTDPHTISP